MKIEMMMMVFEKYFIQRVILKKKRFSLRSVERKKEIKERKKVVFNFCAFVSVRLNFINGCGYTVTDPRPST